MYYIGIDLGGTNIAVGIVDESFKIVKKGSTPTLVNRDPELIIADMGKLCLELLAETGIGLEEVVCAGIAAPGSVNPRTGIIEYANNLPFLRFPIADTLRKYLPVRKVYLENDANAAALGEAVGGAAKGKRLSVMITLGTGVGGGVIIDGKIYSGFNYAGAELGHTVIEYNGRQCSCGRKGCFEAYASATALVSMTKEKLAACKDTLMWEMCGNDINKADARIAFAAMKKGDRAGKEVVDMYISYLACGITNMINIFQPEVLLIGGGVCNEKDYLLKPLTEIVNADQYTRNQSVKTEIKIAALGNDAGIVGAAALGR
ncbi:MAG: ROK family protein [Eubacteriales bacterium]|uniref:Glucokinase ROK family n=1 Tax=Candidatus Colimorpha enterica TaxID=3083063 RepID=R6TZW4_9BACT|nr:ROK family protein [Eubacteriales bacterium]CDC73411.1 glucokinase ROK family [Candidatus Colimorpha enterica]